MEYNFREIEKKWQQRWVEEKTYQVTALHMEVEEGVNPQRKPEIHCILT